jgi:mono/diheme cytochrome c family protein
MSSPSLTDRLRGVSPRWSPNAFKAMLLSFVALAFIIPLGLVALPFIEFFNGMAAQPKGKAQMTYGRVHGQELLVERPPVEGTIPRSYQRYAFDAWKNTLEDAKKVGPLIVNPLAPTMEHLERGREIYNVYCIACHGTRGEGDGPITGPDRFPAPPTLQSKDAIGFPDGTIYHIITKGTEKMPSYADKVNPEERWMVVEYVRALQRSMNPAPGDLAP